jgi:hypothetical protein
MGLIVYRIALYAKRSSRSSSAWFNSLELASQAAAAAAFSPSAWYSPPEHVERDRQTVLLGGDLLQAGRAGKAWFVCEEVSSFAECSGVILL